MSNRRKPKAYNKPVRHVNDQGKPTDNRGKPPHRGGYHGKMKGINPHKIWFLISTGEIGVFKKASSDWSPGKTRKKGK